MYRCDRCERSDFKSESGLKRHQLGCIPKQDDNTDKIEELRRKWNAVPDAEYRHKIEQQIRELKES